MGFYKEEKKRNIPHRKATISNLQSKQASAESPNLYEDFKSDWEGLRFRNECQKQAINAFFVENKKYLFLRIGRKGSKTTTNIDIAWGYSLLIPNCTTYICLPTITQAIEVYWDEKRLQWCDINDPWMQDKYVASIDNNKHMMRFINGSTIKLIGTWSEARGRGTQPNLLIVDELMDASADYLDAVEPNLAAKADARCVMTGTPPKIKNHYHEWEERIKENPEGFHLKHSSYGNTALPHLKSWLDKKKIELIKAGKEDVWLREYMAEDCFRSDDRLMPDVEIQEFDEMLRLLTQTDPTIFQPIFGLFINEHHITATYSVMFHTRETGTKIHVLESEHINRIWDTSYRKIYEDRKEKMDFYSRIFPKKWRQVVYDETEAFSDIIRGLADARKDLKWSKRGIPLLKEMILNEKMFFSSKAGQIGVECQKILKEDDIREFPTLCTMAMLANEYYQAPSLSQDEQVIWDRYAPLREAGIVANLPKRKGMKMYVKK